MQVSVPGGAPSGKLPRRIIVDARAWGGKRPLRSRKKWQLEWPGHWMDKSMGTRTVSGRQESVRSLPSLSDSQRRVWILIYGNGKTAKDFKRGEMIWFIFLKISGHYMRNGLGRARTQAHKPARRSSWQRLWWLGGTVVCNMKNNGNHLEVELPELIYGLCASSGREKIKEWHYQF